ncbi:hypothetical protein AB3Y40_12795 [Yoonia sp. R2331]|uniref:hypothetical protein n=1 Tax=Yoonia sp. R2331 TaxID=3237238 RepID=UPI0034E52DA5
MTALKEYERLESGGLWRADATAQRRDVVVSFGNATLVISDGAGRPLTHWSLAAVTRQNPGKRPAVFAPDTDTDEALEVEDTLMVDAIEKVRKTVARARPRKGKLRGLGTVALLGGLVALGVFWLPDAMRQQALGVVPMSKRVEIGVVLLNNLQGLTGPVCRGAVGTDALARFETRVLGTTRARRVVVMPLGQEIALPLPGGITALDRSLIERLDDPAIAAGFVLAAEEARKAQDPLLPILERAGFTNTVRLLATGDLPTDVLDRYAVDLIGDQAPSLSETTLLGAFETARIPSTPFGTYRQEKGQPVMELIVNDPVQGTDFKEVLSDGDWVSLQGICD